MDGMRSGRVGSDWAESSRSGVKWSVRSEGELEASGIAPDASTIHACLGRWSTPPCPHLGSIQLSSLRHSYHGKERSLATQANRLTKGPGDAELSLLIGAITTYRSYHYLKELSVLIGAITIYRSYHYL